MCIAGMFDIVWQTCDLIFANSNPLDTSARQLCQDNAAVLCWTCTDGLVITGLTRAAAFLCRYGLPTRPTLWLRLTSKPMCAAPSTTQSPCTRLLWEQQTTLCSPMTCARVTRLCTPTKVPSQPSKGPRPPQPCQLACLHTFRWTG